MPITSLSPFHAAPPTSMRRASCFARPAVTAIAEITHAADVVMIARGDLAVEIGDADVPPIQKRIVRVARRMNKIVITATQMMESMIENAIPTRAEVSDVANAVLDG